MSAKRGHVSVNDAPATKPDDWNSAFVTHSADELRKVVAARRTRGPNKHPTKEQVAVTAPRCLLSSGLWARVGKPAWTKRCVSMFPNTRQRSSPERGVIIPPDLRDKAAQRW